MWTAAQSLAQITEAFERQAERIRELERDASDMYTVGFDVCKKAAVKAIESVLYSGQSDAEIIGELKKLMHDWSYGYDGNGGIEGDA